jgi:hypothetical protein
MAEAKGINPQITTEEIMLTPEVKEEVKEAPSKLRQKLRQLAAVWEGANVRSSAAGSDVVDSSLTGMYGAKWQTLARQTLAKESEQGRPHRR